MSGTKTGTLKMAAARARLSVEEYSARVASGLKCCWRCRAWKSVDLFGPDRSRWDGRAAKCMPCRKPATQRPLFPFDPNEYARRHYAADPESRFRRQQKTSQRRRGVDAVPLAARESLLEWTGGLCLYCDEPATTWDHIVPVSKGGQTVPGNIAPACARCNSRKKALHIDDFLERYDVPITERLEAFIALAFEGRIL